MLGLAGELPARRPARLAAPLEGNGDRTRFMRAHVEPDADGWRCTPFARQDSSLLSVLAEANALLVRPANDGPRSAGEQVEFTWL
jgi:molybdopterin molybdotransferase